MVSLFHVGNVEKHGESLCRYAPDTVNAMGVVCMTNLTDEEKYEAIRDAVYKCIDDGWSITDLTYGIEWRDNSWELLNVAKKECCALSAYVIQNEISGYNSIGYISPTKILDRNGFMDYTDGCLFILGFDGRYSPSNIYPYNKWWFLKGYELRQELGIGS